VSDNEVAKLLLQDYDCSQCTSAPLCEMYDDILKHEKICENFQKRNTEFFIRSLYEKNN
jgi:hypothetical protein